MSKHMARRELVIVLKWISFFIMIAGGGMVSMNLFKTHSFMLASWPLFASITTSIFITKESKWATLIGFIVNFIIGFSILLGRFSSLGNNHSNDSLLTVFVLILIGFFSSTASLIYVHELFQSNFSKLWSKHYFDNSI